MRRKDLLLFGLWAAIVLLVFGRPLADPAAALANFGDLYTYHYPLRHLMIGELQSGRLPFWNPYIFLGLPLSANSQAGLFYPLSILGSVLPLMLAFSWDYAFHLLWGGLGMLLLARREGLSTPAGLWLATLFCFCPFVVYRIVEGIPTLLAALSWAPWCWLALLSRRRGFLTAAWALQLLSGHPQFLIVNALAMGVWVLLRRDRLSWLWIMTREGLAALLLTCLQWQPTADFLARSVRRDWPAAFSSAYAMPTSAFLTWLHPGAVGNPLDGTYAGVPSLFFETTGLFIGWVGIAAAALGLYWRRGGAAGVLIFLGAFLAVGKLDLLSGLLRTPARYQFLCLWGLLMAAGSAARRLEQSGLRANLKALLLFVSLLELLVWDQRFLRAEEAEPFLKPNAFIARHLAGKPFRVLTDPDLANPDKTMLYRAMNVNGYDAFYLRGFPAYAAKSEGAPAVDSSRSYLRRGDSPEMRGAGVAYVVTRAGGLVRQRESLGLAYAAFGDKPLRSSIVVNMPRPSRWRVRGRAPDGADRLVVTIPHYPGWRARLDGRRVQLEPWDFFSAVHLPPRVPGNGYFTLNLDFEPRGWTSLCLLATLAWAAFLAAALRSLRLQGARA